MADPQSTDEAAELDEEFGAANAGSSRGWKIAAVLAVVASLCSVAVLAVLLFGGDSGSDAKGEVRACIIDPSTRDFTKDSPAQQRHQRPKDCPPKGAKQMDGLVTKTTTGGFTMRRIVDGELQDERVKLYVRTPDRPYIDIAHAQTHAALGQPIRVYTQRIDGRDAVVYMEDAPLLQ